MPQPLTSDPRCPLCATSLSGSDRFEGEDRAHRTPGRFEVAVCRDCSAGVTLPPASPEELSAFYPAVYGAYAFPAGGLQAKVSTLIQRGQAARTLATTPVSALSALPPGRAIDVGCGRGDLGAALIERGWRVTGIEPSAEACERASERGLDARRGDVMDVELEPAAYDAVSFQHSLEHLTDPVGALRRVAKALRPRGIVVITVPNFGGWQAKRFRSRWYHLDLPRHRVHFTPRALSSALRSAGFGDPELSTSTTPVGLPASIQYAIAGRCLFPSGLPLRFAVALTTLAWPISWSADRLGGGGDALSATAQLAP